ncbi:MAG: VCBS repeat-containing protein [Hyphomonadaceae bacterium]
MAYKDHAPDLAKSRDGARAPRTRIGYAGLALCAALAAGCASPARAEPPDYQLSPFFLFDMEERFTAAVDLADVDGDGDLDVLTANGRHWAQPDFVYLNRGDGRLLEALPLGASNGASYLVHAADLDLDGLPDAVVVRDELPVQVFRNTGGRFELAQTVAGSAGAARSGAIADLDGDGFPDLVTVQRRGPSRLYRGDGQGGLKPGEALPGTGRGPTGVALADIDADGDLDIAVACRDDEPSLVLVNDGSGGFDARALPGSVGDHRNVVLADINGDGLTDLVLGSTRGAGEIYAGDGRGGFTRIGAVGEAGRRTQALAAADLDLDGDVDLVEGAVEQPNRIYLNDGKGAFSAIELEGLADPPEGEDTYGVAVGDMNGDGLPDIVFANSGAANIVMLAVTR